MTDWSSKMREAREEAGMSLRELEEESGVRRGLLSRYESGDVKSPRYDNVKSIAKALGVTVEEMMS